MCLAIEAALDGWRDDPEVALVVIDGKETSNTAAPSGATNTA
jgi:enoyl-CoA hydratase/carnithine racemase